MIATESEIADWTERNQFEPIQTKIRDTLRGFPSIFIGLSGQDFNLKAIARSQTDNIEDVSHSPARILFTSTIGSDQKVVLKGTYGEQKYLNNSTQITREAKIPLYAKPLLGALYLEIIREKLSIIINKTEYKKSFLKDLANDGLESLLLLSNHAFDEDKHDDSWLNLVRLIINQSGNFLTIYRDQKVDPEKRYRRFYDGTLEKLSGDENVQYSGYGDVLALLGMLFDGASGGRWTIDLSPLEKDEPSQLIIKLHSGEVRLFILRSAEGNARLAANELTDTGKQENAAIIYVSGTQPDNLEDDDVDCIEIWLHDIFKDNDSKLDVLASFEEDIKPAAVTT